MTPTALDTVTTLLAGAVPLIAGAAAAAAGAVALMWLTPLGLRFAKKLIK